MKLLLVKGKDFCCFSEFELELDCRGLVYVTGENMDTDAAGSNGSGKSTVFKAITWCLYGDTIDGEKGDSIIRKGATRAVVEMKWLDDKNKTWTVVRERAKGKPSLTILDEEGNAAQMDKDQAQEFITQSIGIDFLAFKNSVLYGQNDSYRFADPRTKDSDRKMMLHKILRTEVFKGCSTWISNKVRTAKRTVDETTTKLENLNRSIADMEEGLEGLVQRRDEWLHSKQEEAKAAKAQCQSLMEMAEEEYKKLEAVPAAEASIQKLEAIEKEAQELGTKISSWNKMLEAKRDELEGIRSEVAVLESSIHGAQSHLSKLKGDQCPTCTSPLTSGKALVHIKEQKANLEKAKGELARKQSEAQGCEKEMHGLHSKYKEMQEKVKASLASVSKLSLARAELASLQAAGKRADDLKRQSGELLESIRNMKKQANPFDELIERSQKKLLLAKKGTEAVTQELAQAQEELAHCEFWVEGFGLQGLPSLVLDGVMPFLTERANHYLRVLADGDITVAFSTQRELKSKAGEKRDEIDIRWTIEGQDDVTPSGGQRKKIEIATDLALMDLVSGKDGNVDLLLLDEVLDGLDKEGRERIIQLLRTLRSKRKSIFVISHEADMADEFEHMIRVVKEGHESRLECVQ